MNYNFVVYYCGCRGFLILLMYGKENVYSFLLSLYELGKFKRKVKYFVKSIKLRVVFFIYEKKNII